MGTNQFSAVLLGDLNDFIAPSQSCVNPMFVSNPKQQQEVPLVQNNQKKVELSFEGFPPPPSSTYSSKLIKLDETKKVGQVSLSDCLACSGCVTSAETVLLKQQSVQEFFTILTSIQSKTHPTFIKTAVTISPQVRASLATRFQLSPSEIYYKLFHYFKYYCKIDYILDAGSLPSDISQIQVAKEFVSRYREKQQQLLPLLTSSCPGWVCYAEKTHNQVLPYLSNEKSPQQIAGLIVKRGIMDMNNNNNNNTVIKQEDQIYHVSIMQCPDKKLEASRKEFYLIKDNPSSAEVNTVLTATELCDALLESFPGETLESIFHSRLIVDPNNSEDMLFQSCVTGEDPNSGGSGGLCGFVFRYAARELFGINIPVNHPLPFRPGRNPDTWFLELEIEGKTVLRFAASYGFRNIQEVVRKLKNGTMNWHFVEVMACPGGCTNGGGLLQPVENNNAANKKALADMVAETMKLIPYRSAESNMIAHQLIQTNEANFKTTFNAIKDLFPKNELMQEW